MACEIKYASVGEGGQWGEYKKPTKEYEGEIARLIVATRRGRRGGRNRGGRGSKGRRHGKDRRRRHSPLGEERGSSLENSDAESLEGGFGGMFHRTSDISEGEGGYTDRDGEGGSHSDTGTETGGSRDGSRRSLDGDRIVVRNGMKKGDNSVLLTNRTVYGSDVDEWGRPSTQREGTSGKGTVGGQSVFGPNPPLAVDNDYVIKTLAEDSQVDSKFILSVYDFGGQSVFNVIHPFFLTRLVILLIFAVVYIAGVMSC